MSRDLTVRFGRAALRYCLCTGICLAASCFVNGGLALLGKAFTWLIILAGLGVYLLLTWLDWRDEERLELAGNALRSGSTVSATRCGERSSAGKLASFARMAAREKLLVLAPPAAANLLLAALYWLVAVPRMGAAAQGQASLQLGLLVFVVVFAWGASRQVAELSRACPLDDRNSGKRAARDAAARAAQLALCTAAVVLLAVLAPPPIAVLTILMPSTFGLTFLACKLANSLQVLVKIKRER
ncbi:MAG: hypothetical protein ACI36Y_09570 [Coriobacteriales bacterium]